MALDPGGGEGFSGGGETDKPSYWERDDNGGGAGYGEGPPDGSSQIRLMLDTTFLGHRLQVWTYELLIRIKIGDEQAFLELPGLNALVNLVDDINRKYGGG